MSSWSTFENSRRAVESAVGMRHARAVHFACRAPLTGLYEESVGRKLCVDSEERDICAFLEAMAGQTVSVREIARRAGGRWRFQEDPNWPAAALLRLMDSGVVQCDAAGRYSLAQGKKGPARRKWISPQLRKILRDSGKDFGQAVEPNEPEEEQGP